MCEYIYKVNSSKNQCPNFKYFNNQLPLDQESFCIFHSNNVEWKRKNNFFKYFLDLIELTNKANEKYNFREFKLIGNLNKNKYILKIFKRSFHQELDFQGATFLDKCEFDDIVFEEGANFEGVTFIEDFLIENTTFSTGVIFNKSVFYKKNTFSNVNFNSYVFFNDVKFIGNSYGYFSKFINSKFLGMTEFSNAIFSSPKKNSTIGFINIEFKSFTNFTDTKFNNGVIFKDTSFEDITNFIDTLFDIPKASIEYLETSNNFDKIEIKENARLVFKSTDYQTPLFEQEIDISFKGEVLGNIAFENANFTKFTPITRKKLFQLEKLGKVDIGSKCIKYRHQTKLKTLNTQEGNESLILELCHTFSNYFSVNNGFNLGFEIVERTKDKIHFFYYTDENITEEIFLQKLEKTEKDLWALLFPQFTNNRLLQDKEIINTHNLTEESQVINTIDGVSALMSTFFRVSIRIAFGKWKEKDTKSLINAISSKEQSVIDPLFVHQTIINHYSQEILFGINNQQYQIQNQ